MLKEKIAKVLQIPIASTKFGRAGKDRDKTYNPFGRSEKLTEILAFRIDPNFKKIIVKLPNWAEIVRLILEDDLDSNQLPLRCPQPKKRGRGGDLENKSGADEQIVIRVSITFKQRIIAIPKWQAKSREALYEKIEDLLIDM
ncbi:MAG: hypothetical protein PUP92_36710 [Rhizonema sp. PD38]|nr:hypothetical protein [Rhizonema sp. PD38]